MGHIVPMTQIQEIINFRGKYAYLPSCQKLDEKINMS